MKYRLMAPKIRRKRLKKKAIRLRLWLLSRPVCAGFMYFPRRLTDDEVDVMDQALREKLKNIEMV